MAVPLLLLALVSCAASVEVPPPQTWAAYTFFAGLRKDTKSDRGEADIGGFASESHYVNEETRRSLALWNESWTRQGWTTRVLGPAEARAHPDYEYFLERFGKLPTNNHPDYELACFMRWVAMAAVATHGGVLTDYDMLNVGWPAPQPLPMKATTLQRFVPAAVIATQSQYEVVGRWMAAYDPRPGEFVKLSGEHVGKQHVSDQAMMGKATKLGLCKKSDVAAPFDGDVRRHKHALIHFGHAAVSRRGEGRSRNELMAAALAAAVSLDDKSYAADYADRRLSLRSELS